MPEKLADVEAGRRRAWDENVKLRYLCLILIPELRRAALLPNETPMMRLDYMLKLVDERAATDVTVNARA